MCVINTTVQENKEYVSGPVLNSNAQEYIVVLRFSDRQDTNWESRINEVSILWFLNLVAVMCLIFFRLTVYTGCKGK